MLESTWVRFWMLWNSLCHKKYDAKLLWLYQVYTKFDQGLHYKKEKSLHKVYIISLHKVYTIYSAFLLSLHRVWVNIPACKPSVNLIFAALHHLKTWNEHISATNCPFETNQRTDLITASNRNFVLVCGTFNPYANICPMIEKVENGVIFGAPDIQKKLSDFSLRWHAMYNVRQRTSGPSMSLSRCLWPVVRLWQYGSKHWFARNWVP